MDEQHHRCDLCGEQVKFAYEVRPGDLRATVVPSFGHLCVPCWRRLATPEARAARVVAKKRWQAKREARAFARTLEGRRARWRKAHPDGSWLPNQNGAIPGGR